MISLVVTMFPGCKFLLMSTIDVLAFLAVIMIHTTRSFCN